MNSNSLGLLLGIVGTLCWGFCFWWMHRISSTQNRLLDQLTEQGKRIERLSKEEHDLIREVHPQVSEIKANIEEVKKTIDNGGTNGNRSEDHLRSH
ncbi:MAG: hypothetical protein ABIR24_08575 [Verrucomicrobiota bacterium]